MSIEMRNNWFSILFLVSFIGLEARRIAWFRRKIELDIKIDIKCESNPNATYNIELWEMDTDIGGDQFIDKAQVQLADGRGEISLKGQAKDSMMEDCVEPYLIVRSDCRDLIVAYDYNRYGRWTEYYDAHPKYCIELSQCPECVIYRELGANPNPLRTCEKGLCKDDNDHCVYSDSWSHTVNIHVADDRKYLYDGSDAHYQKVRNRFLCEDLPN